MYAVALGASSQKFAAERFPPMVAFPVVVSEPFTTQFPAAGGVVPEQLQTQAVATLSAVTSHANIASPVPREIIDVVTPADVNKI